MPQTPSNNVFNHLHTWDLDLGGPFSSPDDDLLAMSTLAPPPQGSNDGSPYPSNGSRFSLLPPPANMLQLHQVAHEARATGSHPFASDCDGNVLTQTYVPPNDALLSPLPINTSTGFSWKHTGFGVADKENHRCRASTIPRMRKKYTTKMDAVLGTLKTLHQARISFLDFVTMVLDDSNPEFARLRMSFYADNTEKLGNFFNLVLRNEKGS